MPKQTLENSMQLDNKYETNLSEIRVQASETNPITKD